LILYAFEEKNAETESRMKALLVAYAFLVPINLVLDKYEDFE
jgi:hypothetical protein